MEKPANGSILKTQWLTPTERVQEKEPNELLHVS